MNVAILKIRISKYPNPLEDKRSLRLLKQLMPLVSDERDKHEVCKKEKEKYFINKSEFYFKLVNKLCQVMHDDIEDDDDGPQQSSSSKPTTSPNGYSFTSSNSNTTDGYKFSFIFLFEILLFI
jgi:hypothetical protein